MKTSADRAQLEAMIDTSPIGERFLLPADLCEAFWGAQKPSGQALRVFFALVWISSEQLRSGAMVRFQVSLGELRIASGYEGYAKNAPVIAALDEIGQMLVHAEDGAPLSIFDSLELFRDQEVVEWTFSPSFSDLFLSPASYAIVSIVEINQLKAPLDFLLYIKLRKAWKLRRRKAVLDVIETAQTAGIDAKAGFHRVGERVRRSLRRLEGLMGGAFEISPSRKPGARRSDSFEVRIVSGGD